MVAYVTFSDQPLMPLGVSSPGPHSTEHLSGSPEALYKNAIHGAGLTIHRRGHADQIRSRPLTQHLTAAAQ